MQEYWSGLPFPSSGDLPDPGIEPASATWQVDFFFFFFFTTEPPGKHLYPWWILYISGTCKLQSIPFL